MSIAVFEKETIAYQGGFLALVAGVATALLLGLNLFSADTIALREREDQMAGLDQVVPSQWYENDILATEKSVVVGNLNYKLFIGTDAAGKLTSYAVQTEAQGYAGAINFLVGVNSMGEILGVRVLSHAETPGLGDKIEYAKSKWVASFESKSLDNTSQKNWAVKKDGGQFDQFTGATITPRAVVKGVHNALVDMPVSKIESMMQGGESNE